MTKVIGTCLKASEFLFFYPPFSRKWIQTENSLRGNKNNTTVDETILVDYWIFTFNYEPRIYDTLGYKI